MIRLSKLKLNIYIIFYSASLWILSLIIYFQSKNIEGYEYIAILPFIYSLLILFFPSITKYIKNNVGILIFNVVAFIRYVIIPFMGSITDFYMWRGIPSTVMMTRDAVLLMVVEMVFTFIFIQLMSHRYYSNMKVKYHYRKNNGNSFILKSVILAGLLSIILFPELLQKYNFIFNLREFEEYKSIDIPLIGFFEILVGLAKIIIVVSLIIYCKKRHDSTGKKRYIALSIMIAILNLLIVTGLSRFSILISSIASLFFLNKLYSKYKNVQKVIKFTLICGIFLSLSMVSIYKFFGHDMDNNNYLNPLWWIGTLQMYFSGPNNVGIAITMSNMFNNVDSFIQLFRDLFSSVAGIAGLLDQNLNTVTLYNYAYYGSYVSRDQIVPLLGQGVMYFGYIGAFIPSVLAVWLMMSFDKKARYESNPYYSYLYYFMAAWFGASMMVNWIILFSHLINTFIAMLFILKFNTVFNSIKKNNYNNKIIGNICLKEDIYEK